MGAAEGAVIQDRLDPRIEKAVDVAYRQAESLCAHYRICADDWPHIYHESPRIIARIAEIEDTITGATPLDELHRLLEAWIKNYESAFRRRSAVKQQQLVG